MTVHLHREIEKLKNSILRLGTLVEEQLREAVKAVKEVDPALARQIADADDRIDEMEVQIEEDCLKILALHQPVAVDLRFIVAVLKINNDLERIGDLAVNVAERAASLTDRPYPKLKSFPDFSEMARRAQHMLKCSLDALVTLNAELAKQVLKEDDEVDRLHREAYEYGREAIREHPEDVDDITHLMSIFRYLERVGDQATNIAEDVIYMCEGQIVRHRPYFIDQDSEHNG
jgi:phosphate transport system protein